MAKLPGGLYDFNDAPDMDNVEILYSQTQSDREAIELGRRNINIGDIRAACAGIKDADAGKAVWLLIDTIEVIALQLIASGNLPPQK